MRSGQTSVANTAIDPATIVMSARTREAPNRTTMQAMGTDGAPAPKMDGSPVPQKRDYDAISVERTTSAANARNEKCLMMKRIQKTPPRGYAPDPQKRKVRNN